MTDVSKRRRQPKGIPAGGEFAAEDGRNAADLDVGTLSERFWRDVDNADRRLLWDEKRLAATRGEHAGESVVTREEEMGLMRRAVGDENHPGILMRGLRTWFPDPTMAAEIAWNVALQRILTARRGCVLDPERCYSPALANKNLLWPMHLEQVLTKFGLSAHRGRFGRRYNARLEEWQRANKRAKAPDEVRDRIWDETMDDYVAEKKAKGVSLGHGLTYSDGRNANPDAKSGRRRMYGDEVFNGRKDFEGMLSRFREAVNAKCSAKMVLDRSDGGNDVEGGMDRAAARGAWTSTSNVNTMNAKSVYRTAMRQGLDLTTVRDRLGIDEEQASRWEDEFAVEDMLGQGF